MSGPRNTVEKIHGVCCICLKLIWDIEIVTGGRICFSDNIRKAIDVRRFANSKGAEPCEDEVIQTSGAEKQSPAKQSVKTIYGDEKTARGQRKR